MLLCSYALMLLLLCSMLPSHASIAAIAPVAAIAAIAAIAPMLLCFHAPIAMSFRSQLRYAFLAGKERSGADLLASLPPLQAFFIHRPCSDFGLAAVLTL